MILPNPKDFLDAIRKNENDYVLMINKLMASRDILQRRLVELEKQNPGSQIDVLNKSLAVLSGKEL